MWTSSRQILAKSFISGAKPRSTSQTVPYLEGKATSPIYKNINMAHERCLGAARYHFLENINVTEIAQAQNWGRSRAPHGPRYLRTLFRIWRLRCPGSFGKKAIFPPADGSGYKHYISLIFGPEVCAVRTVRFSFAVCTGKARRREIILPIPKPSKTVMVLK